MTYLLNLRIYLSDNKLKLAGRGRSSEDKTDGRLNHSTSTISDGQSFGEIDPGIISDEDDFHVKFSLSLQR